MPRISTQRWEAYIKKRLDGVSRDKAAKETGISFGAASAFDRGDETSSGHPLYLEQCAGRPPFIWDQVSYNQRNLPKTQAKSTEDLIEELEQVNLRWTPPPLPKEARQALEDFSLFRRRYFGRVTLPWHEEAGYKLVEMLEDSATCYAVLNVFPGAGKSTLLADIATWITVRDRAIRGVNISRTSSHAIAQTARLKTALDRSIPARASGRELSHGLATDAKATLRGDYGPFKPDVRDLWRRDQFIVLQPDGPVTEKEPTWSSFGLDGGILGLRFLLMLCDDMDHPSTLRNLETVDAQRTTWDDVVEERLEPGGLLAVCQQRLSAHDLSRHCLDKKRGDELLVLDEPDPDSIRRLYVHLKWPAHDDTKCEARHGLDAPAWPDGCLLDPKRGSWQKLSGIQRNDDRKFAVVFQQEDTDPAGVLVQPIWLDGGVGRDGELFPGCYDNRSIWELPEGVNDGITVVTADPSPTQWWAVQAWFYSDPDQTGLMGRRYLLDLANRRMDAPDLLDFSADSRRWFGVLEDYRRAFDSVGHQLQYVIVEVNAAQRFLLQYDHVKRWSERYDIAIVGHTTTGQKKLDSDLGIETLKPHYRFGRVRLPGGSEAAKQAVAPLVKQVTRWPDTIIDDQVMAHWFLEANLPNLDVPTAEPVPAWRPSWI